MPRPRGLLIDESRTAQAAFGIGLEAAGFEVLVAGDAKEALDVLAHRRCALVLADCQLPARVDSTCWPRCAGSFPSRP